MEFVRLGLGLVGLELGFESKDNRWECMCIVKIRFTTGSCQVKL